MTLTFINRLTILYSGLLPFSSDLEGIKLNKRIREQVSFSEDEKKKLSLQEQGGGSVTYQAIEPLENFSKDVEFTEQEMSHLAKGSNRLNDQKAVTEDTMDTIEMFLRG